MDHSELGKQTEVYPEGSDLTEQANASFKVKHNQVEPTDVVLKQPVAIGTAEPGPRPIDYSIPSIIACLFCFWPTGCLAMYYSSKATSMVEEGNMAEAQRFSNIARNLMIISIVVGVCWIVTVIAVRVALSTSY